MKLSFPKLTKRQWLKVIFNVLLVVGLIALAVVTGSMLIKRAPYDFPASKLNAQYLKDKQGLGDLKLIEGIGENPYSTPDGLSAIAYYSQDGQLPEDRLISAIIVSTDITQFESIVQNIRRADCTESNEATEKLSSGAEYYSGYCDSDHYYILKRNEGWVVFNSSVSKEVLEKMLKAY